MHDTSRSTTSKFACCSSSHPAERHVEDNAGDIIKKVKVEASNFDGRRDLDFFFD